jgi:hypothetical protein
MPRSGVHRGVVAESSTLSALSPARAINSGCVQNKLPISQPIPAPIPPQIIMKIQMAPPPLRVVRTFKYIIQRKPTKAPITNPISCGLSFTLSTISRAEAKAREPLSAAAVFSSPRSMSDMRRSSRSQRLAVRWLYRFAHHRPYYTSAALAYLSPRHSMSFLCFVSVVARGWMGRPSRPGKAE